MTLPLHSRQHSQRFTVVGFRDQRLRVMNISDLAFAIHQKDTRYTKFEKVLHLKILSCHDRALVGENGVRDMVGLDVTLDHPGSIGNHHNYFRIEGFELIIVKAQLRHMVHAVRSSKANVENKKRILGLNGLRQAPEFSGVVRQGKIGGGIANLQFRHSLLLSAINYTR